MTFRHTVSEGECISGIAVKYGYFPESIWACKENDELREKRGSLNVLLPGDVVVLPDKDVTTYTVPTGKRHRFERRGVPEVLRLELREYGKPRANVAFSLEVEGKIKEGTTDGEGRLKVSVPNQAKRATLRVGADEYGIDLATIDPLEEERGNARRLVNLNYLTGDKLDDPAAISEAFTAFQRAYGLEQVGELDDATYDKLLAIHGY